eukprot:TRINITY_DN37996_c0_g1_i1.p1 TRINITY_DN37996_c0_g1~~TRINITY_DN37996_c0_g1_i1.p1  ORF type:complete len:2222 (-),score=588.26 TRINITY_DN37996_c0_g1_i1:198-6863(-)
MGTPADQPEQAPAKPPSGGGGGGRGDRVAAAILKRCRTKAEGDVVFDRMRTSEGRDATLVELGFAPGSFSGADLNEAFRLCCGAWKKGLERDIRSLFEHTLEECGSLGDADRQFRAWQQKIDHGKRHVGGRHISHEIITATQTRVQAYWAKVTPGNVSLIVDNVAGKCSDWDSAEKKFDWLWRRGEWTEDGRVAKINGRTFTVEDLQQAERRCRQKFNLPAVIANRAPQVASTAPKPSVVPSHAPPKPTTVEASAAPAAEGKEDVGASHPAAPATALAADAAVPPVAAAPAPAATPAPALSNEDFIVEHILKKCTNMDAAKKFFLWLRSETSGKKIRGRHFTPQEVDNAEVRCKQAWAEQAKAREAEEEEDSNDDSSDSEDASDADDGEAGGASEKEQEQGDAEQVNNVEAIVQHVMRKYKTFAKAEKCFDSLNEAADKKNFLGLVCTQEEITEAFLCAQAEYEKRQEAKMKTKTDKSSSKPLGDEGGVDTLVQYVLKKYSSMEEAENCFELLQTTAGERSHLGPIFSVEEVTEAWIRCSAKFEQKGGSEVVSTKKRDRETKNSQNLSNSEVIMRQVLQKCHSQAKADKFFDMLHRTIGKPNPLGRVFTEEDVTEAFLRCSEHFEEQGDQGSDEECSSEEDASSSSSSDAVAASNRKAREPGPKREPKQKKQKVVKEKTKKRRSKLVEDELEGALFGSDDDDLSGEEDVDEEDDGVGAELLADLGVGEDDEPQVLDDNYPAHLWNDVAPEVLPGFDGFNSRATLVMQRHGMGDTRIQVHFDAAAACPPLQPHQESVAFLLHPRSPVTRLLVDHPTGSGKTREMIKVLDNYFYDPRPKVPIFPKEPVCRNFYGELLRWPSRYRDYFCCERPADASIASGRPDWKEYRMHMWDLSGLLESELRRLVYSIRDVLEMKGMFHMGRVRRSFRIAFQKRNPGEQMPLAPLRALGYTSAGGSFSKIAENGRPLSALMKIGYEKDSNNVYCNKIVLMDEAHNLVRSQTQYEEQLSRLRTLLFTAGNLVLAGFTGTPILSEPSEGRQLLDIVKGQHAPEADDGYLSSFPMRPQPLFPLSLPRGIPDGVLTLQRKKQLVQKVEIHGETLKIYEWKKRIGLPGRRLRAYCNVCTFHGSFHDGKSGTKVKILTFPEDCCPKLFAIAQAVAASPEKAVVLCGRMSGYIVMLELMKFIAAKADPPFNVATMDELAEFNHVSNLRGETFRVLVADAAQCSEGISFLACRRTFLADVPVSPSAFIQQCGRAIRMYGHRGLGEDEQTVTTRLYVATLPKWMRSSSLGGWCLRAQKRYNSGKEVEKRARNLTARFMRIGIKTLEDLKARIDAHGNAKYESLAAAGNVVTGRDRTLSSEDVVSFLEQNGLWEEARLLRAADKKDKEKLQSANSKDELAPSASNGSLMHMDSTMSIEEPYDTQEPMDENLDGDTGLGRDADDLSQALGAVIDGAVEEATGGVGGVAAPGRANDNTVSEAAKAVEAAASATAAAVGGREFEAAVGSSAGKLARTASSGDMAPPKPPAIDPDVALAEAVEAVDAACVQMDVKASTEKDDQGSALTWRSKLEETLLRLKVSPNIANAAKVAIHPSFIIQDGTIRELSMEQVKLLRDELHRLRKVSVLSRAVSVLKDVRGHIEKTERAFRRAVSLEHGGQAPNDVLPGLADADVLDALRAEGIVLPFNPVPGAAVAAPSAPSTTPLPAADSEAAPTAAVEDATAATVPVADATAAETAAAVPDASANGEGAAAPGEAAGEAAEPTVEVTDVVPTVAGAEISGAAEGTGSIVPANDAAVARAEAEAEENTWRQLLVDGLRQMKGDQLLTAALKIAVPGSSGDDEGLRVMMPDQVRRLHDELARLKNQEDVAPPRPRALVRAMQALYAAETAADASLSLSTETADEQALAELTERSQEFAPALAGMRAMATDREIFSHLADKLDEDGDVALSESEGSDICKDVDAEPAPVVLPPGWRLEWVRKKKKETKEFVDPQGNRYRSVREVRIALAAWEARERAIAAAMEAASGPPAKRMRLRAKVNAATVLGSGDGKDAAEDDSLFGEGGLEAAFEEALEGALEASGVGADITEADAAALSKAPVRSAASPRPATKVAAALIAPTAPHPGATVKLRGLVAKPELNDQVGTLKNFNAETGRWECQLAKGGKVNVKPANFELQAPKSSGKRLSNGAAEPRPRAKAKAANGGRGRGRGAGAAAAAADAAAQSESD